MGTAQENGVLQGAPGRGEGYNAPACMHQNSRGLPPAARTAAFDPDLLHSRSVLIYVRSSLVLSLLLYATWRKYPNVLKLLHQKAQA